MSIIIIIATITIVTWDDRVVDKSKELEEAQKELLTSQIKLIETMIKLEQSKMLTDSLLDVWENLKPEIIIKEIHTSYENSRNDIKILDNDESISLLQKNLTKSGINRLITGK